jgi:hypothetical protein
MNIPPTLAELFHLAFGRDWRRRASKVFDRSRRQIGRWCSDETKIPRRFLFQLQRRIAIEVEGIERWRGEQHRRVNEAADKRREAACQARTWLKAMLFDRPEWEPPPRGGRPRKQIR